MWNSLALHSRQSKPFSIFRCHLKIQYFQLASPASSAYLSVVCPHFVYINFGLYKLFTYFVTYLQCIVYYGELYLHVNCVCSLPPIFHGDPRDYAWGADGLDNAITQVAIVTLAFSAF